MVDLRCHVIDGTGCGPRSFAESMEMCRASFEDGVRTIVATPYWDAGADEPPLPFSECKRKLEKLQHELRREFRHEMSGALDFKLGFTMQFRADLPSLLQRYGSQMTLGGGEHVLVSLPSLHTPAEAEEVWDALIGRGYCPVVTRPECSFDLRRSPSRLAQWVARGVILQLDAPSITGAHGREVQRFAAQILEQYKDRIVVASGTRAHMIRRASLGAARRELTKRFGAQRVRKLFNLTPGAIIGNSIEMATAA